MRVLLIAVGIALFFEGVMPFLSPPFFRRMIVSMLQISDRGLRTVGFVSIVIGAALVYLVRDFH